MNVTALQHAIVNSTHVVSIATDCSGIIRIFNPGAEQLLGYPASGVVDRMTPAALADADDLRALATSLERETGATFASGFDAMSFMATLGDDEAFEMRFVCRSQARVPVAVAISMLLDDDDRHIGFLLMVTDSTVRHALEHERARLDQRLRDEQFRTRSLFESNIDALMTTDTLGIITDVNRQTEFMTGYARDALVGTPFRDQFTDPDLADAAISRALADDRVTDRELTTAARDGSRTSVSLNATTFHDRDQRLQGVIASARDMTSVREFERTLQQKNLELEEASRMKSEFLANMSHELRTPLNAIIGFSELLHDGLLGDLTDKQRRFIGDIFTSGRHLLDLINDILDLSKVESGKMTLELEDVHIGSMLVDSLAIIREKAMTRRIRLATVLAPDDSRIQVDQRKLKQIVYNLLSNAVKFTPEGGQVVLQATRVSASDVGQLAGMWPGRAFPTAEPVTSDTFLKISVTDSGIGIKADDLPVLFAPFTQVDSGLARKFDGTGLGLALVRRLAELQGGTVAVESQEDVGSSFIVWVPYHDAAPNAVAAHEYAEPVGVPTRYVTPTAVPLALIVEDDFKAAALLRMHLESIGLNVLHAASAEAALAMALQQPLDLISLDILLPNMDGWDFLSRIKQVPALARVPVVIISIIDDHQRGFALGAAAIIQKPVTRQTLFESLVGLGLFPRAKGHTLNVLVVDDDPAAVELTAVRFEGMADSIACAYSGRDAIDMARAAPPDLIVLDLMMPDISGFDVVDALTQSAATAAIPILVVTAKEITAADHTRLHEHVTAIMRKGTFDSEQFLSEARRAIAGRRVVA